MLLVRDRMEKNIRAFDKKNKKCSSVLVPMDYSDVSYDALDQAKVLARMFGYSIHLLHVAGRVRKGSDKELQAIRRLKAVATTVAQETGIKVSARIREGSVYKTIYEVAGKLNVSFIVMGVHGKRGVQALTGSYSYKVVCQSSVPVLVVKNKPKREGFREIVVPIDFSRRSTQKISQAIRFATIFKARIRVFGFLSSDNVAKIINKEALLKSVTDVFADNGVEVTTDLRVKPGMDWPEALVAFSEAVGADLVMIVAEKGGRIQEIFNPSYTEQILDLVNCPVLTIAPCDQYIADESWSTRRDFVTPFIDPFGVLKDTSKKF